MPTPSTTETCDPTEPEKPSQEQVPVIPKRNTPEQEPSCDAPSDKDTAQSEKPPVVDTTESTQTETHQETTQTETHKETTQTETHQETTQTETHQGTTQTETHQETTQTDTHEQTSQPEVTQPEVTQNDEPCEAPVDTDIPQTEEVPTLGNSKKSINNNSRPSLAEKLSLYLIRKLPTKQISKNNDIKHIKYNA